jgi:hypothetical protein
MVSDKLFAQHQTAKVERYAESDTVLRSRSVPIKITFITDNSGTATGLRVNLGGLREFSGRKIR